MSWPRRMAMLLACAAAAAGTAAGPAAAKGGDDDGRAEIRKSATCDKGATGRLRLRSRDGEIRVDFQLAEKKSGSKWTVVVVHERKVAARLKATTAGSSHRFEVRHQVEDYEGADAVSIRASGPRGMSCSASATLAE